MKRDDILVYTAITGNYDNLKAIPPPWMHGAMFLAFVDGSHSDSTWPRRPLALQHRDPCRNAKKYKILAHRYTDAKYSIWIDGSVEIVSKDDVMDLVSESLDGADICLFRHRTRNCIVQEAEACIRQSKDDPEIIRKQVAAYLATGYPMNNGLHECTVLIRRHTPEMNAFCEAWHAEIDRFSRRDQLSFDYVLRKTGTVARDLPGTIADNSHFLWLPHANHK